jgi:hypothetical protein
VKHSERKVADQAEVIGEDFRLELGHIPARQVAVDAIHERGVVAHLGRQRLKQVADALLMFDIHIEVADHDDGAVGADALLAARELAGLHVALHDVHAILLIEGNAGHLIEAHHVVLANQAALAVGVVDEHARHRRLAAGNQVRIGRHLLEQVRLAGAPRPDLDQVVVALDERDHAQQHRVLVALGQFAGSRPMERSRKSFHSAVVSWPVRWAILSSTSRCESWIARKPSTPNGRPFFSWAIVAS